MYALFQEYDDCQFLIVVSESIESLEEKIIKVCGEWDSKIEVNRKGDLMYKIGPFVWYSIEKVEVV